VRIVCVLFIISSSDFLQFNLQVQFALTMAFPTVVVVKEDGSSQTVIDVTMEDEDDVYEATTEEIEGEGDDLDDEIDDDVMQMCVTFGCTNPAAERAGSQYCYEHRCTHAFCIQERDVGFAFCHQHRRRCATLECPWKLTVDDEISGSRFCKVHRCSNPECVKAWDNGCDGFCREHAPRQLRQRRGFCAFGRCDNYPLGNLVPFCALHLQKKSDF
jgi:hypothetical protein